MSINEIKKSLINLYFGVKVRKLEEIKSLSDDLIKQEEKTLDKLPPLDIINYISNSIETLIALKVEEKYEQKILEDEEKENYRNINDLENDPNGLKLYEGMLIKAESDIRGHIRVSNNKINLNKLKYIFIKLQIEQELKIKIEDLKNDLELVLRKYNELNEKYNNLINKKLSEENRKTTSGILNKNNILLSNIRSRLSNRLNGVIINYSNLKNFNTINVNSINDQKAKKINNKEIKSIPRFANKNEKSIDNDLIHSLKKENEMLKKIVTTYKRLNNKKSLLTKEKIYYNNREQRFPENLKTSVNKTNSKEHSLKSKVSANHSKNKKTNKSPILFTREKTNNSLSQNKNNFENQIITDSSLILSKTKKLSKNKKVFNTINNNSHNIIRRHNAYLNNILKLEAKNNIIKKKINNKFKTKKKELLLNDRYNSKSINNSNNLSKEKNINKITPKKESKNSQSFLDRTNYDIKSIPKKNNILNSTKKFNLGKKFINLKTDDIKNNIIRNYLHNNKSNNIEHVNLFNKINTESNNNSVNTTIYNTNNNYFGNENKEHKLGNKFRLMKDDKTEEERMIGNTISSKKVKIDRNKIFFNKSNISLQDSLILKKKINEICDKNYQSLIKKNFKIDIKNKNLIINNFNKYKNNKLHLNLDNERIIGKNIKIKNLLNDKAKAQNNTINNISNFNNCNYIYLFNNGEKLTK